MRRAAAVMAFWDGVRLGEDGARLSDPERGGARNGWERERRRRG